jgi:hypothetical protein
MSNVEGRDLHPIGEEPVRPPRSAHEPEIRPSQFHWAPDGKAILFRYDDGLYELSL